MELNKKDIYENVRRDVMRKQTLHSSKNLSGSNPVDTNPRKRKSIYVHRPLLSPRQQQRQSARPQLPETPKEYVGVSTIKSYEPNKG